jgi:hypothetical protein
MKILLVIFFMKLVLAWTGACDSKSCSKKPPVILIVVSKAGHELYMYWKLNQREPRKAKTEI